MARIAGNERQIGRRLQRQREIPRQSFHTHYLVFGFTRTAGLGAPDAVWVNRATGELVRRYPQRAALNWYAPVSPSLSTPTLAVPGGVKRDEGRADERFPE